METSTTKSHHAAIHLDEKTWIRMGRIYRRFPFLANTKIVHALIVVFFATFTILMAILKDPCTCAEQIPDEQLKSRAAHGDTAVRAYMNSKEDAIICAAKRQELLQKLEKEEKLKDHHKL